ncbi:MAG TPA: EF-P lysine aminoacylase GenX, partial [Gammaproteobacteria bacterium]|nr:EF-P lysine aminoacylase GenX [Gammaproteobacteria bacterium]
DAPSFPANRLTLITHYPASQAALARLHPDGHTAARFELFWGDLELANGYHELANPTEQRQRFQQDLQRRQAEGLPPTPLDQRFLAALDAGLPDCAGVALGLDRLLMKLLGVDAIEAVLAFPLDRA